MAKTGYSGTPLLKKLGILPSMKVLIVHEPEAYATWLNEGNLLAPHPLQQQYCRKGEQAAFVHVFAKNFRVFETEMKKLEKLISKNKTIIIWISWYKKSSGIATDLTEDSIRAYALQHGLVDVKVCAVSNEWSGLKLVVPLRDR